MYCDFLLGWWVNTVSSEPQRRWWNKSYMEETFMCSGWFSKPLEVEIGTCFASFVLSSNTQWIKNLSGLWSKTTVNFKRQQRHGKYFSFLSHRGTTGFKRGWRHRNKSFWPLHGSMDSRSTVHYRFPRKRGVLISVISGQDEGSYFLQFKGR